jgi:hypothetical protein
MLKQELSRIAPGGISHKWSRKTSLAVFIDIGSFSYLSAQVLYLRDELLLHKTFGLQQLFIVLSFCPFSSSSLVTFIDHTTLII